MTVHLTKIYTKGGDKGTTSLVGGQRVAKSSLRLEAYGTVDELNCQVGVLVTLFPNNATDEWQKWAQSALLRIQHELFDLGSVLATAAGESYSTMRSFEEDLQAARLESEMDEMLTELQPLRSFVLPGGSARNAAAHVCRAVCRRAERIVCALEESEPDRPGTARYLNRLSDWAFVFSRWVSLREGVAEVLWDYQSLD